ncbi:MAG: hypothetical protein M0Z76_09375 [Gammaproteobacteria bacterium]|nr:hypothetical protein [Gammaproteobacteria bacterium]
MAMPRGQKQMFVLALLATVMTVGTLIYMLAAPPGYLRRTHNGVPYFTPPVLNPAGGKPLDVNRLAAYYRGNTIAGLYATVAH